MSFAEVTEMEVLHGDTGYTQWLAAGRPELAGSRAQPLTEDEFLEKVRVARLDDVEVLGEVL